MVTLCTLQQHLDGVLNNLGVGVSQARWGIRSILPGRNCQAYGRGIPQGNHGPTLTHNGLEENPVLLHDS